MSGKYSDKNGGKALRLSSEYIHLLSQRHSKTFLENARLSSRWTLADKIYSRKVVIWQQNFIAVLSRTANPVNGIAQYSDSNDLKQGPQRSRFDFWQNEWTWKPSELVKGKKLQEKNEFLPNFWMSANFPQLPILSRKRSKINMPHSLTLKGSEAVLRGTRSAKLPS